MVAVLPALAMAAPGLIQAGLGFLKGRDQLRRTNRQIDKQEQLDQLAFLRQNQEYDAYVKAQSDAYLADVENLSKQYEFNARARQNVIETGLTQLSDISDTFIQKAMSRNIKLAEVSGRRLATGQTGKSVRRLENLQQTAAGRNVAADAGSMERAVGAFMFREKEAKFQQEVANQNAFNQVRKPIFGPRPVAPQKRIRPEDNTFRDFAFGAGSALAGGFLGQFQAEQATNIFNNTLPGVNQVTGSPNRGGLSLGNFKFASQPPIGSIGGNVSTQDFGLSSLGFAGENPFGLAGLAAGFKPF